MNGETKEAISVKEARKLLGKAYKNFPDEQITEIVELLNVIAKDFIHTTVPRNVY